MKKQVEIEFIVERLAKGKTRQEILQEFTKTYNSSVKTFDNRLKIAYQLHKERQEKLINVIEDVRVSEAVEAAKNGLKSNFEIEQRLLQIGFAEIDVEETTDSEQFGLTTFTRKPTPSEQKAALAEVLKLRGAYAPEKTEQTIIVKVPDEE